MTSLWAFLLAIAILVGVHEYGHYKVAVALGVRVLRFSLGFGPVVYRSTMGKQLHGVEHERKGETEFVISLIPLGGYVTFLDESSEPTLKEDWSRAFHHQSLFKRSLIVLAGPMANFALAIVLLWAMNGIGFESAAPVVSTSNQGALVGQSLIPSGSQIINAGVKGQTLDRIEAYPQFEKLVLKALLSQEDLEVEFQVRALVAPKENLAAGESVSNNSNKANTIYNDAALNGAVNGTQNATDQASNSPSNSSSNSSSNSPSKLDVQATRRVTLQLSRFELPLEDAKDQAQENPPSAPSSSPDSDPLQTAALKRHNLEKALQDHPKSVMAQLGFLGPYSLPVIGKVSPDGAAAKAGLRDGDQVLEINQVPVLDAYDLRARIASSARSPSGPIEPQLWTVLRQGEAQPIQLEVRPERKVQGQQVLARIEAFVGRQPERVWYRENLWQSFLTGFWTVLDWTQRTCNSIYELITGQAPLAQLGGPIALAQYAGESVQMGFAAFLSYLALISINLGVFNLLPIPPLDGGHLLSYAWQGMMGRRMPERWREGFQKLGLALVLVLSVFALRNDLMRLLGLSP